MIDKTQLDNGATIITYPRSGTSAAVGLWLENGARHQQRSEDGYAHLLEHLLFRGTDELSPTALAACFEAMGGRINAATGRELTALYGIVPATQITRLLQVFIQMLCSPRFSDLDLGVETAIIAREAAAVTIEEAIAEQAVQAAWREHPLAAPILGDPTGFDRITAEDLRRYLHRCRVGKRLAVVVVGAIAHETVVENCAPLARLPTGSRPIIHPPAFQAGQIRETHPTNQAMAHWLLLACPPGHPNYLAWLFAERLLCTKLGRMARLESGLAYAIQSNLEFYSDAGLWHFGFGGAPKRIDECIAAIHQTVDDLRREGPHDAEIDLARQYLMANLTLVQDNPYGLMEQLAREHFYLDGHPSFQDYCSALARIDSEAVARVIAGAWPQRLELIWTPS